MRGPVKEQGQKMGRGRGKCRGKGQENMDSSRARDEW